MWCSVCYNQDIYIWGYIYITSYIYMRFTLKAYLHVSLYIMLVTPLKHVTSLSDIFYWFFWWGGWIWLTVTHQSQHVCVFIYIELPFICCTVFLLSRMYYLFFSTSWVEYHFCFGFFSTLLVMIRLLRDASIWIKVKWDHMPKSVVRILFNSKCGAQR